jgi:hypothetical protein
MTTEKQLQRLRENISEVAHALESFLDIHVQPTADECNTLQQQLYELQESLAVYKYGKTNKELSPSFNLHSKVSEQQPVLNEAEKPEIPAPPTSKSQVVETPAVKEIPTSKQEEPEKQNTTPQDKRLEINLNDKFRFINELFKQNQLEYALAIEQLNTINNTLETDNYLMSLKNIYGWNEQSEVVKRLYTLARQRFS